MLSALLGSNMVTANLQDGFDAHVEYFAEASTLTQKESEAYFHWYLSDDRVTQREMADEMGISESTFSGYLSKAKDKLDDNEYKEIFSMLFTQTGIAGVDGKTKQIVDSQETSDGYIFLLEDSFNTDEKISTNYMAFLIYRDYDMNDVLDDAPDDIILYDKWTNFKVFGNTKKHLVESLDYYMKHIDAIDSQYEYAVMSMLVENGFSTAEKNAKKAVEELLN